MIFYQRPFKICVRIIAEAKPACRDSRSLASGVTRLECCWPHTLVDDNKNLKKKHERETVTYKTDGQDFIFMGGA